ncbi:uncharacterized protein LOC123507663 isoform X1 [Portunus trituberculatus]|uniref:uncharacterized protein LOC123507663 isoform X1 n=1 Tax=Portunus trituberculatus TaxID=210409 RepID=UPI001E1CC386|nr:uncharacterized protein LOC123507663 isoform X1 [Portunus trituberculatus]
MALKNTTLVLSTAITTFSQINDKVYYRLTHKEEVRAMREAVEVWGIQHAITDNLQFMLGMGHTGTASDRWWEQDKAVAILPLRPVAMLPLLHILRRCVYVCICVFT